MFSPPKFRHYQVLDMGLFCIYINNRVSAVSATLMMVFGSHWLISCFSSAGGNFCINVSIIMEDFEYTFQCY